MIRLEKILPDNLTISLDIYVDPDYRNVSESIDIDKDYDTIVEEIKKIIISFGYTLMEKEDRSNANSIYFTFCDNDEFLSAEVTLIARMRVSGHKLPLWPKDKSERDAIKRQMSNLQKYADENRFVNKNLFDEEHIPVDYVYVRYENKYYTELDDLYSEIRRKLSRFKSKHS